MEHTNEYALWHRENVEQIDEDLTYYERPWKPLSLGELKIFIGIQIYMRVYGAPKIPFNRYEISPMGIQTSF